MKTMRANLLTLLSLTVIIFFAGCSDNNVAPEQNDSEELNLTDDFGGYKATDEAPAFGDADIISLEGSEEADDPMMLHPEVDSLKRLFDVDAYSVEFLWGKLELDSSETNVTDWSGSISVDRGAIIAVRLIRFEHGDYIVRPRFARTSLDFVSMTMPSFDGMLVYVYDPNPTTFDVENSLSFRSGPYSRTFSMSELADISEIVEVGDNQFSVNGFKLSRLECGEGFLEGRWVRPSSERGRGTFGGRWISQDGLMLGHARGHFGTRDDGTQVIFGKWISLTGAFRGFLKGEWEVGTEDDPAATDMGTFSGDIFSRERTDVGDFSGSWIARQRDNSSANENDRAAKHGYFRGQWSQNCD